MSPFPNDDPLQKEYFNKEAVQDIADAFDISYDEAVILWCRFVGTVEKLREITQRLRRDGKSEGKGAGSYD